MTVRHRERQTVLLRNMVAHFCSRENKDMANEARIYLSNPVDYASMLNVCGKLSERNG